MYYKFIKFIGGNFGNPKGIVGSLMTLIMNVMNQKLYKTILKSIKSELNKNLLDIGFGNGYLIKKLLKDNNGINIYGIEISNDMFKKVQLKNRNSIKDGKLKLLLENIEETSFENNMFDIIITINTIYFWNDYKKCFTEIKRILKHNGKFFNTVYTKEYLDKIIYTKYGFRKNKIEEIKLLTEKNGMKIIETIEIEKGKSYCIISEKIN